MRFLIFVLCLVLMPAEAFARFPADAGYINVKDFGAAGDGVTDDTKAIQDAINSESEDKNFQFWQHKLVFFPEGTYLISDTLTKKYKNGKFASGMMLIGANKDKTILKLMDKADGFSDPAAPKALVFTSSKISASESPTGGSKDYEALGEGNDAYMNYIEDITIDVGANNSGAIGIDYLANNMGAIRNVRIKAAEGSGHTGIAMIRKWPGPLLIQDIDIDGFDIGIDVAHTEYGVTLDHVRLNGQKKIGLRNKDNMVSANDLFISGASQNIDYQGTKGMVALAGKGVYSGGNIIKPDWGLPVKDAPQIFKEPKENWIAVKAVDGDDTQAIRDAFETGASTIYFPHAVYEISDNIIVPPNVRRIVGMNSTITPQKKRQKTFSFEKGMFRIVETGPPLAIEKLAFDNSGRGVQTAIEMTGARKVLLRDIVGAGVQTFLRGPQGGEAFIENTCCGLLDVSGNKGVWLRQFNSEGEKTRMINRGSPLWVLGLKTEKHTTILENLGGAHTEIIGGLVYVVVPVKDKDKPAFINENSKLIASFIEEAFYEDRAYNVYVSDLKGNILIRADEMPERGAGRIVPNLLQE